MKFTILLIRIGLLLAACFILAVSGNGAQDAPQSKFGTANTENALERIKTDVYRLGIGEKSTVIVKMRDGTLRKGYLRSTTDESFEVTNAKTGKTAAIAYSDVSEVRKPGRSIAGRVAFRITIAAAVTAIILGTAIRKGVGLR